MPSPLPADMIEILCGVRQQAVRIPLSRPVDRLWGVLVVEAPILIGNGDATETDNDVVLDGEGRPFIPGESIGGRLKAYLLKSIPAGQADQVRPILEEIFGSAKNPSLVDIKDAFLVGNSCHIKRKDGIAVDATEDSKTTTHESKHDHQYLPKGTKFTLRIEIQWPDQSTGLRALFLSAMAFWKQELNVTQGFALGAKTYRGLGFLRLDEAFHFEVDTLAKWQKEWPSPGIGAPWPDPNINTTFVTPWAKTSWTLKLQSPLLIQDPSYEWTHDRVKGPLMEGNQIWIPGTSIAGVLKHHARRFLPENKKQMVNNVFGSSEDASKIVIKSAFFDGGKLFRQARIRVDSILSGTIEGALFQEDLVWPANPPAVRFEFLIEQESAAEAQRLLAWLHAEIQSGLVAIGSGWSVGRGRWKSGT